MQSPTQKRQPASTIQTYVKANFVPNKEFPFSIEQPVCRAGAIVNVIIIGDGAVGKSTFYLNFYTGLNGVPAHEHQQTIGLETCAFFYTINPPTGDPYYTVVRLWDTAGQENYMSITRMYYRQADIVIMMYDINEPDTLTNLLSIWYEEVLKYAKTDVKVLWAANKTDLLVPSLLGRRIAEDMARIRTRCKNSPEQFQKPALYPISAHLGISRAAMGLLVEQIKKAMLEAPVPPPDKDKEILRLAQSFSKTGIETNDDYKGCGC
jgi:small GTP-binding protein